MRHKVLIIVSMMMLLTVKQTHAQIPRPPESIRIPPMIFDEPLPNIPKVLSEGVLPVDLKINGFIVSIGKTTLSEVLQKFQTGAPLYDGRGYYQCYSLPRYSHQIWFITKGVEMNAKITEVVVKLGGVLPTDYCPLITSSSYPVFNDKIKLGANPEYLEPLLGRPLDKKRTTAVYLFQLPQREKLKVQVQGGKKGIEMIKVTEQ